jgi:SAM-dependent methyltransferase
VAEIRASADAVRLQIEGIDLAGMFDPNPFPDRLTLRKQSVDSWVPTCHYNLVTIVHGLHYVGDKLALLAKVAGALTPAGLLIANLDLANFRNAVGRPAGRTVAARLRRNGLAYDARRHLVRCEGPRTGHFGLTYLGADDGAGPNYTGQAAVDSYYAEP